MQEKLKAAIPFRLRYDKKNNVWLAVALAASLALWYASGFQLILLAGFLPLYYLINSVEVRCSSPVFAVLSTIVVAAGAWFTVLCVQHLLLSQQLFNKTKDQKLLLNFLVALAVYLAFMAILNNTAMACTLAHILMMVLAIADYFVYSFRGNELTFADLRSAGTGLSVASNYRFVLSAKFGMIMLMSILYIAAVWRMNRRIEKRILIRIVYIAAAVGAVVYIGSRTKKVNTETWEKKGTYKNGFLLNFCLQIRDSFVSPPEGYSQEAVEELESQYEATSSAYATGSPEKRPTIIVIMNESFADLKVIGSFRTNVDLTPFIDSLADNTIKGYALSSVYSAKTPNSEWEYMTGNSMAFMPQGSVVYQQFISDEPTSIVSYLSNIGYTCVAMHPYYETGWSRNSIYPTMGFKEMYFIEHFDENAILRKYITDDELYDKIIERYEQSPAKEDLFIMSVTMQNHGGYGATYDNMEQYVHKNGISYTDVNQYLQLIHVSDASVKKLVSYFSNVEDPVEIVFFGDHQPGLNSRFYKMLNGKGLSGLTLTELEELYTVPFFIWTNYETSYERVELTSLNFLSTLTLERAGIDLPGYNQFLADMMEVVPAINSQAYWSNSAGGFKYIRDAEGEEAEWINKYNILQYNNMFDLKHRSSLFFPYLDNADQLTGGLD